MSECHSLRLSWVVLKTELCIVIQRIVTSVEYCTLAVVLPDGYVGLAVPAGDAGVPDASESPLTCR